MTQKTKFGGSPLSALEIKYWLIDAISEGDSPPELIAILLRELADSVENIRRGFPFKGWLFSAPYFCMYCGKGIKASQFVWSRDCGCGKWSVSQWIFVGPHERIEGTESLLDESRFMDPRTEEGRAASESMRAMIVQRRRQVQQQRIRLPKRPDLKARRLGPPPTPRQPIGTPRRPDLRCAVIKGTAS